MTCSVDMTPWPQPSSERPLHSLCSQARHTGLNWQTGALPQYVIGYELAYRIRDRVCARLCRWLRRSRVEVPNAPPSLQATTSNSNTGRDRGAAGVYAQSEQEAGRVRSARTNLTQGSPSIGPLSHTGRRDLTNSAGLYPRAAGIVAATVDRARCRCCGQERHLQDRPCLLPWPNMGVRGQNLPSSPIDIPPSKSVSNFQTSGECFLLMGFQRVVLTGTLRIGSRAFIDRLHLRASYDLDLPGPSFF